MAQPIEKIVSEGSGAPAAGDAWDPLAWVGDPKYPWFITIPAHCIGLACAIIFFYIVIYDADPYSNGDARSVLAMFGGGGYAIWAFSSWWPRNIAARYRWYWIRAHDHRVVSDLGDAPNAKPHVPLLGEAQHRPQKDPPVVDSIALRIRVAGRVGFHDFVWMGTSSYDAPFILWRVVACNGTHVTIRDRLGYSVIVTPQVALRMVQFRDLDAYWRWLDGSIRQRNTERECAQRIQRSIAHAHTSFTGIRGRSVDEWRTELKTISTALQDVLTATARDRNVQSAAAASTTLPICMGSRQFAGEAEPYRWWFVALMHGLLLGAGAAMWYGVQLYRNMTSFTATLGIFSGVAAVLGLFLGAMFGVTYLLWFLLLYWPRNISLRHQWYWDCAECGPVRTMFGPDQNVHPSHVVREGTRVIREQVSGWGRSAPSGLFGHTEGAEWEVIGARRGRIRLRHGFGKDRLVAKLPPHLAVRVVQHDEPSTFWLMQEQEVMYRDASHQHAQFMEQQIAIVHEELRALLGVKDPQVFEVELPHIEEVLATAMVSAATAGAHPISASVSV